MARQPIVPNGYSILLADDEINVALTLQLIFEQAGYKVTTVNSAAQALKKFDEGKRYDIVEELEAKALYEASTEAGSGVMEWIRGRW